MIKPPISRWPLLVTGPLQSLSDLENYVVLIGAAAHAMVIHMAQGAATSLDNGACLARCLKAVVAVNMQNLGRCRSVRGGPNARSHLQAIAIPPQWLPLALS